MTVVDLTGQSIDEAQDPICVTPGEYKLRLIECDGIRQNKADNDYILPRFEVVGEPLAKDFTYYLPLFSEDYDEKRSSRVAAGIKNFCLCFGIPTDSFDTDELQGLEGWAMLGVSDDPQYGEQNYIKKFVVGA